VAEVPAGASPRFYFAVTPRYFETVGLQLLEGRRLSDADRRGSTLVVVINREMARRVWPGQDPIGRRIRLGAADSLSWRTVVGIVSDIENPAARRVTHYAYVPFSQAPQPTVRLLVAARAADPAPLVKPFRDAARSVDADLPLLDLMTVAQDHNRTNRPVLAYAMMMVIIGATALLLAGIGLYGIVAFAAEQRTREVGVRIALGAKRADVLRLITRQGLLLVGIGVAIGVAGSFLVLPVMKSALFGLWNANPFDPLVFAGVIAILVLVAVVASYIPARRATRVDPTIAMRIE